MGCTAQGLSQCGYHDSHRQGITLGTREIIKQHFIALFQLGRISNLPTAWTNTCVALVVCQYEFPITILASLCIAISLFYLAGMFLNDAFDYQFDLIQCAGRPIPSGKIKRRTVLLYSLAMLILATLLIQVIGYSLVPEINKYSLTSSLLLILGILIYNL